MSNEPRITGVGISRFGRLSEETEESLSQAAILAALADAGVGRGEIQAVYCGNAFGAMLPGQRALRELWFSGQPVYNVDNACSSGATALKAGVHDTVLVFCSDKLSRFGGGTLPLDRTDWNVAPGMTLPGLYAVRARLYLEEHGYGPGVLADVAVKNRRHGLLNPIAGFAEPATREEVLASRMVADPLTLWQCCPSTADGAAALVLTTRPSKGAGRPARVRASVVQSGLFEVEPVDMTGAEITRRSAKLAYEQAGLGPEDLDLIELHDAFTISELLYYEALGGRVPVNPSGGLMAKGHPPGATGAAQIVEIVEQLRGTAGGRQVEGARIGLAQVTGGGIWGMDHAACAVHVLEAV
jgi:acetyl-CoA acetyltransferase